MSIDPNPLIGYWVLESAPESPHEVGVTYLRFTTDGVLQEGNENEWRIYVLSFQYWIEGDSIATVCPPNPRTELTPFAITPSGNLVLSDGRQETVWTRNERKEFFESKSIWDPGFLFDRQVDYMALLESEPYAYQVERAIALGMSPQVLVNTDVMWKCWKYGKASFAAFHPEDFEEILARGVLIGDEDDEDRTLLSYLAEDGNSHAVQKAVQYGADVNHRDIYENTALDYATWVNRSETTELLKTLGARHGKGSEF